MENPGSLLRRLPNAGESLFACGCSAHDCFPIASDYEFFRAFCKVQKKLSHHRLTIFAKALLAENGCREELSQKNTDAIWRYFSELHSILVPKEASLIEEKTDDLPPQKLKLSEFVRLEDLIQKIRAAGRPGEFEKSLVCAFEKVGKRGVLLDFPEDFYTGQPSLYAVEQALAGSGENSVLQLQAIRIFAERRIPMLVFLQRTGESALSFFSRLESLVGLPEFFLALTEESLAPSLHFLLTGQRAVCPVLTGKASNSLVTRLYYSYPMGNTYQLLQE